MDQLIFTKRFGAPWHLELTQLGVGETYHSQLSKRPQFEVLPCVDLGPHDLGSLNKLGRR
jgi:hypothetical protein